MKTLSQARRSPALRPLDLRNVRLSEVVAKYGDVRASLRTWGDELAQPEREALSFYLTNAAYAKVVQRLGENEPLGEYAPLVESYLTVVRQSSLRLFYYLLLICTRESRHVYSDPNLFKSLDSKYGCMGLTKAIKGKGSDTAVEHLLKHAPAYPLGQYTDHLVEVFAKGGFSSSYGGAKWAAIAEALRNFVHGVTSAELLLDTGFTLAHNGGPIFNKQMLYAHYTPELVRVLDVQRAGMIPQLVCANQCTMVQTKHRQFQQQAAALLGSEFEGEVDWLKVAALGAVGQYPKEIAKQKAANKAPPKVPLKAAVKTIVIGPDKALATEQRVQKS